MGFFDFFSTQPENQIDKGREAAIYFHNQASRYSGYDLTLDQMIDKYGGSHFLEGLGFAIEQEQSRGFDWSGVRVAMERLADRGNGKIPASSTVFFQSIGREVENTSFVDAITYTARESAKDLAFGVQQVGNAAIDTLSSLKVIAPLLIVGGVIYIFVSKVRKVA